MPAHSVFGEGTTFVPLTKTTEANATLKDFRTALAVERRKVADGYADAVARQALALGPTLFNAALYKTKEEVEASFTISWRFVSFAPPDQLQSVDGALAAETQQQFASDMAAAYHEARLALREMLHQLVAEIAEKLSPAEDGSPRVFRNTILNRLVAFLEAFPARNLTDDGELARVAGQLKKLARGIDPGLLVEHPDARPAVLAQVKAAAAQLDGLVTTGRRAMWMPDGSEDA